MPTTTIYHINGEIIPTLSRVRDAWRAFRSDWSLSFHHRFCILSALKMLRYIKRFVVNFDSPPALRVLYSALVHYKLDYALVIWAPYQQFFSTLFERVQHRFLRFAYFRLGSAMGVADHDYSGIGAR